MALSRPTVLILSSNPAFAREIAGNWPADANSPEFTVIEQGLARELGAGNYDLAIADATSAEHGAELKRALVGPAKPAIVVHSGRPLSSWPQRELAKADSNIVELGGDMIDPGKRGGKPLWPVIAGLLGREMLRRVQAEQRARDAGTVCATEEAAATLGRYIAEMRHNINNALTSVLGNAELITLEPGLPAQAQAEAETILNMGRRLHEVFRRFASLEQELSMAARQSSKEVAQSRATSSAE
ncbi:MAG TPA: hypothetical protein VMI10_14075 [Terriglobales bacterium]|nr:hypothetical protein [Terriglobales bacterium]